MKQFLLVVFCVCLLFRLNAQDKKGAPKNDLPGMNKCIQTAVENLPLYIRNLSSHSEEHDVNSIILDIEKYIDSMPKTKKYSDILLMKQFDPLRHFFLTTTNKTTVASSFLYTGTPYQFCFYNDTALALHIKALKDGDVYNLSKMKEGRIIKVALQNCLLPSLKALDEFKASEIKYVGFSIYYGCKDTREGAPNLPAVPYCITLVARLSDIQQYADGLITAKGLLANGEVYISNEAPLTDFRRIQIELE